METPCGHPRKGDAGDHTADKSMSLRYSLAALKTFVSLNSMLESNKEEDEGLELGLARQQASTSKRKVNNLQGVGGVPREQKILKGHLPRVTYHQVY